MKIKILTLLSISLLTSILSASMLKNGDFEKGTSGWKGDKNVDYETPDEKNKICQIKVKSKRQEFYQAIKIKDAKDLNLSFRVRTSPDYEGRGISIHFIRQSGSYTFYDRTIDGTDWAKMNMKFSDFQGSKKIIVKVVILEGEAGSIEFDDFELVGK